jgi:hypothetical protein
MRCRWRKLERDIVFLKGKLKSDGPEFLYVQQTAQPTVTTGVPKK